MNANKIFYKNNLGFISLKNCKPRQVFRNEIGAYFLKRCNKTKQIIEVYLKP